MADTDGNGIYQLYRQGPGTKQGAAAGLYTVKVMSDANDGTAIVVPPEYNTRSEMTCEVQAGRLNTFDINIRTAAK